MGNVEKLGVLVIIILVVVILVLTVWGFTMPTDEFADDPGRPPQLNSVDGNGTGATGTGRPADQPRQPESVPVPPVNSNPGASPWPVRPSPPVRDPDPDPIRDPDPLPDPDPVPDAPLVHTVKDGETPWSIAKQYLGDGNRFEEILALNPGVTARNMSVGTKLKIPTNRARPAVRSPVVDSPPSGNLYVVKEGDSLWKIAKDLLGNGTASARILEANRDRLTGDGSNLYPGMTLKIPR